MKSSGEEIEILLVEDNEGDIRLFEETLKEGKVCNNLTVIKDGKEASDYLKKKDKVKPHIVFLDINLPSLSRVELLKELKKGEIVLKVEKYPKSLSPAHILFSVLDTGMGIPKDKQAFIFENFTQADSSITRRFGGTGLGLSISRNLAELMGGGLKLVSEEGKGSTFSFDIPFHVDSSLSLSKVNKKRSFEGKKALVIEKNKTQIQALKVMLKEVSMDMEAFSSVQETIEFLDKVDRSKIDVILLDARFLDEELKGKVKEFEKYKDLSKKLIVMLSSNYKPENLKMVRYFGAKRYLIKPILKSYLRHSINNLLNVKPLAEKEKHKQEEFLNEKPLKILYAEDCEANRMLFELFLKKTKHNLDFAENGKEAVDKVTKGNYDIIFLDVQMPVKDGLTAAQEIRAWEEKNKRDPLPIYSLTAHALKEDVNKSIDAGCNGHITKPVKKAILLKKIRKYSTTS